MKQICLLAGLWFVLVGWVIRCQQLTVQTDSGKQVLSRTELEVLPQAKVAAQEHSSLSANFEGVTLKNVLEKAGLRVGESIKGKRLATCFARGGC